MLYHRLLLPFIFFPIAPLNASSNHLKSDVRPAFSKKDSTHIQENYVRSAILITIILFVMIATYYHYSLIKSFFISDKDKVHKKHTINNNSKDKVGKKNTIIDPTVIPVALFKLEIFGKENFKNIKNRTSVIRKSESYPLATRGAYKEYHQDPDNQRDAAKYLQLLKMHNHPDSQTGTVIDMYIWGVVQLSALKEYLKDNNLLPKSNILPKNHPLYSIQGEVEKGYPILLYYSTKSIYSSTPDDLHPLELHEKVLPNNIYSLYILPEKDITTARQQQKKKEEYEKELNKPKKILVTFLPLSKKTFNNHIKIESIQNKIDTMLTISSNALGEISKKIFLEDNKLVLQKKSTLDNKNWKENAILDLLKMIKQEEKNNCFPLFLKKKMIYTTHFKAFICSLRTFTGNLNSLISKDDILKTKVQVYILYYQDTSCIS